MGEVMRLKSVLLLLMAVAVVMLSCSDKKEDKDPEEQVQTNQTVSHRSVIDSLAALQFDTTSSTQEERNFSLIGTWHFSQGAQQADVTYKPDGTFLAKSKYGEQLMDFYGTYTFNGSELTSTVTNVKALDATDKQSVKDAENLNARIAKDPSDLSATATIEFNSSSEFTSIAKDGRTSIYTRVE
jgi:hypothetical protein